MDSVFNTYAFSGDTRQALTLFGVKNLQHNRQMKFCYKYVGASDDNLIVNLNNSCSPVH